MNTTAKVILWIAILVIVIVAIWLGVSRQSSGPETIKIGFIGPLTGDVANLGQASKGVVKLAVSQINEAGGINGKNIEIIYEDGKCSAESAVTAANKLINVDKVPVILGALCSSATMGVAPVAEQTETVLFSYCSSNPDITNAGDYIFRNYPSDSFQGTRAAEIAYNELGARKIATLYCLSDYCVGLHDVFEKRFQELGGTIALKDSFEQASSDLRTQLTKVKEQEDLDLIYLVSYTKSAITGLKQIKELGIETQVLGVEAWDDPTVPTEAGNSADGAMYLVPVIPDLSEEVKIAARAETGVEEVSKICTPSAYDAMNIIADIMKQVGTNSVDIKEALYNVSDYQGISGIISIDENGDLKGAEYSLKIFEGGKSIPYESATTTEDTLEPEATTTETE